MFTRAFAAAFVVALAFVGTPAHAGDDICAFDPSGHPIVCIPHGTGGH